MLMMDRNLVIRESTASICKQEGALGKINSMNIHQLRHVNRRLSQGQTRENSHSNNEFESLKSVSSVEQNSNEAVCHYSDIRNRKFKTKFLCNLTTSKNIQSYLQEQDSVVIQNDRLREDDISYSEEVVGSVRTIYTTDENDEEQNLDFETQSQI